MCKLIDKDMKKIKISELPLYNSLKGLFTIGTDKDNRSVKVSLEFIETSTQEAIKGTQAVAKEATTAANAAATAAKTAQEKATVADTAAKNADTAKGKAETAANEAVAVTEDAKGQVEKTKKATEAASKATEQAVSQTAACKTVTDDGKQAIKDLKLAAEDLEAAIKAVTPTNLAVSYISYVTMGAQRQKLLTIDAVLTPATAQQNVIFITDGHSVRVGANGLITPLSAGKTYVRVIPTMNVSLEQDIEITVGEPACRFNTRNGLRLTSSGTFRFM